MLGAPGVLGYAEALGQCQARRSAVCTCQSCDSPPSAACQPLLPQIRKHAPRPPRPAACGLPNTACPHSLAVGPLLTCQALICLGHSAQTSLQLRGVPSRTQGFPLTPRNFPCSVHLPTLVKLREWPCLSPYLVPGLLSALSFRANL